MILRQMRTLLLTSLWSLWAVWMCGCAGSGTGTVAGAIYLSECTIGVPLGSLGAPAPFDLQPTYFAADPITDVPRVDMMNRVSIRIQSAGNQIEEADGLFIKVADVEQVGNQVGAEIPVGPATNVRASMLLKRSCPRAPVQIELDGTIRFSRFGTTGGGVPGDFRIQYGDFITAVFDFTVVDRRTSTLGGNGSVDTTPEIGGRVAGDFDFQVRQGRGAQAYP
jgi:hypothetical protein